jgi:hypothetical protein
MIKVKGRGRPGRFRVEARNDGKGRDFQDDKKRRRGRRVWAGGPEVRPYTLDQGYQSRSLA